MSGYEPTYTPGIASLLTPSNPTAPASTSAYKMQGLSAAMVAQKSGNVLFIVTAIINASATTVGNGINLVPYCGQIQGSNTAPDNAAGIPGNAIQIGGVNSFATGVTLTTAADLIQPITVVGLAQQLPLGVQYWFDLAAESITTVSDNALKQVNVILVEV